MDSSSSRQATVLRSCFGGVVLEKGLKEWVGFFLVGYFQNLVSHAGFSKVTYPRFNSGLFSYPERCLSNKIKKKWQPRKFCQCVFFLSRGSGWVEDLCYVAMVFRSASCWWLSGYPSILSLSSASWRTPPVNHPCHNGFTTFTLLQTFSISTNFHSTALGSTFVEYSHHGPIQTKILFTYMDCPVIFLLHYYDWHHF